MTKDLAIFLQKKKKRSPYLSRVRQWWLREQHSLWIYLYPWVLVFIEETQGIEFDGEAYV